MGLFDRLFNSDKKILANIEAETKPILDYENDVYTELKKDLPKIGMIADTEQGMGKVVSVDVFKQTYSVDLKEKGIVEFSKDDKNGSSK